MIEGCDESTLQDRVCAFAARFQPPSSWTNAEEISHAYQDLSDATRTDLNNTLRALLIKERQKEGEAGEVELAHEDYVLLEEKADAALEAVEEIVMSALYDRMFAPALSGDAQEDENLASRIAALNLLELSLDHLGLDLSRSEVMNEWEEQNRTIRDSLEDIVGIVGKGELPSFSVLVCSSLIKLLPAQSSFSSTTFRLGHPRPSSTSL